MQLLLYSPFFHHLHHFAVPVVSIEQYELTACVQWLTVCLWGEWEGEKAAVAIERRFFVHFAALNIRVPKRPDKATGKSCSFIPLVRIISLEPTPTRSKFFFPSATRRTIHSFLFSTVTLCYILWMCVDWDWLVFKGECGGGIKRPTEKALHCNASLDGFLAALRIYNVIARTLPLSIANITIRMCSSANEPFNNAM